MTLTLNTNGAFQAAHFVDIIRSKVFQESAELLVKMALKDL